jgi:hypothetical protein
MSYLEEPVTVLVKAEDYSTATFPLDLVFEDELAGMTANQIEISLANIKRVSPEIVTEVTKGDDIEVTFSSYQAILSAAKKLAPTTNMPVA